MDTYYLITSLGAILMILTNSISLNDVNNIFLDTSSSSPINILILFISMTFLSISLDNLGFFDFIAYIACKRANGSQKKLFITFFIVISFLTAFTSNDVVILTFTPFICYFSKKAKVNPIPYLILEFTSANTLSMLLLIGNPTNILISLTYEISFFTYLQYMILPTIGATVVLFILLYLIFHKSLEKNIEFNEEHKKELNIPLVIIALIHLVLATILLAIANYINISMHLISLSLAISLGLISFIYTKVTKKEKNLLTNTLKRLPYSIIPFLISMFILVNAININGYTKNLADILNNINVIFSYGYSSLIACNIMNNIPMSILFSNTLAYTNNFKAIFSVIIGSNLGAYLTPLGALAGIMFIKIIKSFEIDFKYKDFIKYGMPLALATATISLLILYLV